MTVLIAVFFAAAIAWLVCAAVKANAHKWHLVDVPNARSSHVMPTPRGGGLGIVIAFYLALAIVVVAGKVSVADAVLLLPALPVAVLGFIDDRHSLSVRVRMLVQLLCAIAIVCLAAPEIFVGGALAWVVAAIFVVYAAWLINLFNFMDGIDGIAATQAIVVLASAAVVSWLKLGMIENAGWLLLSAACAGFLLWNWSPAKLFMGDVGSTFIGAVLAAWSLASASVPLASWLILMAVFIGDATYTLLRRAWRREPVWQAHRSHLYQHLARRWDSHARVCVAMMAVGLVWLLPLAIWAMQLPDAPVQQLVIVVVAYLPLMLIAYTMT